MKILLSVLLLTAFAAAAVADIQAPPLAFQGPARKFGRGISNLLYGECEFPVTICQTINGRGDSAAFGLGILQGINRTVFRMAGGVFDVVTFPFPLYKGSYQSPYPSDLVWGPYLGYSEFPPELGFETRYDYVRLYGPE